MPSPNLQQLREQRASAASRIRELADRIGRERRDFTADERANWDAANAEYDRLGREIGTAERLARIDADGSRPGGDPDVGRDPHDRRADKKRRRADRAQATEEQRSLAFRAWAKAQYRRGLTRPEREACRALRFDPRQGELTIPLWPDRHREDVRQRLLGVAGDRRADLLRRESRANMSAQIPAGGSYFVPPGSLTAAFETNLLAFGGVRQVADTFTTASGEPVFLPTVDDTTNTGVLLGENTQAMFSGVNPTFGLKRWDAYKYSSTPILVPTELLEDSQYDLPGAIGEWLGIRLGRITATHFATGDGASKPEGIVTGATLGVTAATATAITYDELVRLVHSIDPAYRGMPGTGWLLHDQVLSYIRRIKDGNGRPLYMTDAYQSGVMDGAPDRMHGFPINICQEMASSVASSNKTVLFGVLPKYRIRKVRDVRMYRLVERFRDLDQDGFVAFMREDGRLIDAGTHPVKYLQQAA